MFSALGLLTADLFHDYSRPIMMDASEVDTELVERLFIDMELQGKKTLEAEEVSENRHKYNRTLDMRYKGQGFELNIAAGSLFDEQSLLTAVKKFYTKHRKVYGFAEEDEPVEIVNAKLRAIGILNSPKLRKKGVSIYSEPRETRLVYFENLEKWCDVGIFDRINIGTEKRGPAIIEQYDSTSVIYPNWSFKPDEYGNLLLRRSDR
jgi:N-methylhydantoinase A